MDNDIIDNFTDICTNKDKINKVLYEHSLTYNTIKQLIKEKPTVFKKINEYVIKSINSFYNLKGELYDFPINIKNAIYENKNCYFGWWYRIFMIIMCQNLGDTIGYYNGIWEFNKNEIDAPPERINDFIYEFISLGGINEFSVKNLMVSDDSIMYMSTFKVLLEIINVYGFDIVMSNDEKAINEFGKKLRDSFLDSFDKLSDRHIGNTTSRSLITQRNIEWNQLQYNSSDIGSGTTMRTGCIGIIFCGTISLDLLIAYSVEASRITHNSAIAILGGFTAAYFTSLALTKVKIEEWPRKLLEIINDGLIDNYINKTRPNDYKSFIKDKVMYVSRWETYISKRFSGRNLIDNITMKNPIQRFRFFADNISKGHKFVGSCADDSIIMAYDSLIMSEDNIEKLIFYSILHPGDSDTVGSIAFSLYGAYYGYVEKNHFNLKRMFREMENYNDSKLLVLKNTETILKILMSNVYYDFFYRTCINEKDMF